MQAIVTKFLAPTSTRGARVKATADAGSRTVAWDHRCGIEDNHRSAALLLAARLGWDHGPLISGSLPGCGYAHVFAVGAP